jgi:hypothetical protein
MSVPRAVTYGHLSTAHQSHRGSDVNDVRNVLLNLIAAFIGIVLGWSWRRVVRLARHRHSQKFWKRLTSPRFRIVVGLFQDVGFAELEWSGLIGAGDNAALLELQEHFDKLKIRRTRLEYPDRLGGDARKENLILIGGQDGNRVTGEVMARIGGTLSLVSSDGGPPFVLDSTTAKEYRPERLKERGSFSDYGIIVLGRNPFNPKTYVLVVAGLYGFGSWAGARLVTQEEFARNDIVASGEPFEAMFMVDVADRTPQHVSLVMIRPLSFKTLSNEIAQQP